MPFRLHEYKKTWVISFNGYPLMYNVSDVCLLFTCCFTPLSHSPAPPVLVSVSVLPDNRKHTTYTFNIQHMKIKRLKFERNVSVTVYSVQPAACSLFHPQSNLKNQIRMDIKSMNFRAKK